MNEKTKIVLDTLAALASDDALEVYFDDEDDAEGSPLDMAVWAWVNEGCPDAAPSDVQDRWLRGDE